MLSLAPGLQIRQFEGEGGAVAFIPSTADTHLLGDAGLRLLVWLGQASQPMTQTQVVSAVLAEHGPADGVDVLALDTLLGELLQSGLLVELAP
jgi:hypothetical protein